jgi:hypothetical protein
MPPWPTSRKPPALADTPLIQACWLPCNVSGMLAQEQDAKGYLRQHL